MDLLDSILKLQEKYDDPDVVVKASDIKRPQSALDREMFEDANKRFNQEKKHTRRNFRRSNHLKKNSTEIFTEQEQDFID